MSEAKQLEDGFYWVNWVNGWEIAQYDNGYGWTFCGDSAYFIGNPFNKIGPKVEPPKEVENV